MLSRVLRASLVAALVGGLLVVGAIPAAAEELQVYPLCGPSGPVSFDEQGNRTSWSWGNQGIMMVGPSGTLSTPNAIPDYGHVQGRLVILEPCRNPDGRVRLGYRWTTTPPPSWGSGADLPGGFYSYLQMSFNLMCAPASGFGSTTYVPISSASVRWSSSASSSAGSASCPAGRVAVGAEFLIEKHYTDRSPFPDPNVVGRARLVSYAFEDWEWTGAPDAAECWALFGPPPWGPYVTDEDGRTVEEAGCAGFDTDWWGDFDSVCAGAPETSITDWSWLGEWVGHYASCLFIPQGELGIELLTETFEAGWMGDVRDTITAVTSGINSWDGACGTAVMDLPGSLGSVSTCQIGSAWPASFRTAAGYVVATTGALAAFFAFARFMGWTKGGIEP